MLFINYSKTSINICALVITIILSILINQLIFRIDEEKSNSINKDSKENVQLAKNEESVQENNEIYVPSEISLSNEILESNNQVVENLWQIEIPKINLIAPVYEGTTVDVLNSYVGHFEETSNIEGNVGLAAHNRGYQVNYFKDVKQLSVGDEIIYNYYGNKKQYIINLITIIQDTDWSYLQETSDNRITLITCVEDMPELRRCVQGIEKTN